jgi:hypothetical protein
MKKYFLILFFISPFVFAGQRQCKAYYAQMKANKNRNFKLKSYDNAVWIVTKDGMKLSENDKLMIETFSEACSMLYFYIGVNGTRPAQKCKMHGDRQICYTIEYGD